MSVKADQAQLIAVAFCAVALKGLEQAARTPRQTILHSWIERDLTIDYVTDILLSAAGDPTVVYDIPRHPDDQRKVAVNVGQLAVEALSSLAQAREEPRLFSLQDVLIALQREQPGDPDQPQAFPLSSVCCSSYWCHSEHC